MGATGWQGEPRGWGAGGGEALGLQASLVSEPPSLGDEPVGCRALPGLKVCLPLGSKVGEAALWRAPSPPDSPEGRPRAAEGLLWVAGRRGPVGTG